MEFKTTFDRRNTNNRIVKPTNKSRFKMKINKRTKIHWNAKILLFGQSIHFKLMDKLFGNKCRRNLCICVLYRCHLWKLSLSIYLSVSPSYIYHLSTRILLLLGVEKKFVYTIIIFAFDVSFHCVIYKRTFFIDVLCVCVFFCYSSLVSLICHQWLY